MTPPPGTASGESGAIRNQNGGVQGIDTLNASKNTTMKDVLRTLIRALQASRSFAQPSEAAQATRNLRKARRTLLDRVLSQPVCDEPRNWQREELYDRG